MKNLTKLVNRAQKAIGFGVARAIFCGTVGCATMTKAQKTALWGDALTIFGSITMPGSNNKEGDRAREILTTAGTVITNQAGMQERLEIANAGKSQIIINNNPPNYQNQNQSYNQNQNYSSPKNLEYTNSPTPEGFFMYENWVDSNNDGLSNGNEFFGFNERVYDLRNLNSLQFAFYGGGKSKYGVVDLNLKIYSLDDNKVINYFDEICKTWKIQNFTCESKYFPKSGKYKAVLNAGNNKTFSLDFEIIK
ncbi:MAG: hypothetical protein ABIE36_03590 [Candidatus Diapherotrites archaeon]